MSEGSVNLTRANRRGASAGGRRVYRIDRSQRLAAVREAVFDFFADAANLEAVTPGFLRFRILTPMPVEMRRGARIEYSLALFGVPFRWRTVITRWEPGVCFVDEQESGPYAFWRHTHRFADSGDATQMTDSVEYALPFGPIGRLARWLFVRRTLERIFDFRRDTIAQRFAAGAPPAAAATPLPVVVAERPASPAPATTALDLEVYYDGECPLCAREIRLLRRLDRRERIRFVDIAAPGFDPGAAGVSREVLMARIHARLPDGTLIEGVEVFRRLYAAVGFERLVALTRLPGVARLLDLGYRWFAARRLRLTRRCRDSACATRSANGA
jgi:hypothetical protein